MHQKKLTDRRAFIRRWMDECNVTYDAACQIYRSMVNTFEAGVMQGNRIDVGKLGALVPKVSPARQVKKGFDKLPGGQIVKAEKMYYLDERLRYTFRVYEAWLNSHELNWW